MSHIDKLNSLKITIEKMSQYHQEQILKIFVENNTIINENQNGCFINLTDLKEEEIQPINKYVNYVNEQEKNLDVIETEKDRIQKIFFKQDKDIS
tara:strand:- start:22544 stop:22828 length:285 start_codon:yes stop_codon:yes gene_type:complete